MKNKLRDKEKFEEVAKAFTADRENFVHKETLRIFCETNDLAIKLEALKLLAAQI